MSEEAKLDDALAFMLAMAKHGVPPDVVEVLVQGGAGVPPGALMAGLDAVQLRRQVGPPWKFKEGQMVRKRSGSWWEGEVVGTYSTLQTRRGYAVQLVRPDGMGPVQIYPESALEACEEASDGEARAEGRAEEVDRQRGEGAAGGE